MPSIEHATADAKLVPTLTANPSEEDVSQGGDSEKRQTKNEMVFMADFPPSTSVQSSNALVAAAAQRGQIESFFCSGTLVNNDAPLSAIGSIERGGNKNKLIFAPPPSDPKPESLRGYDLWQLDSGILASSAGKVLG